MNSQVNTHASCQPDDRRLTETEWQDCTGMAELFKALADETRTRILSLLLNRELCVCELAASLAMSLPAVSHHLRLLKMLRLVATRREGKQVYYSLLDQHVADLIRIARDHLHEGDR